MKNVTGSLTIKQAEKLLQNPPVKLDPNVKDLLNTMCEYGEKKNNKKT